MASRTGSDSIEPLLVAGVRTGLYLTLLIPLIVSVGSFEVFFPFVVGKALYGRALIEVAFALWLILVYRYPQHRPRPSYLLAALAIYVFVAVLAGALGVSWQRSLWSNYERMQGIVDLAHWLAFVAVASSMLRSWTDWRHLLNVNLGVSLVVALLGLAQHFNADVPVYRFLHGATRLEITLGNATYVGAFMLVNALLALGFLIRSFAAEPAPQPARAARRRGRRRGGTRRNFRTETYWRAFWLAVFFLDVTMLWLSAARGALLGLVVALIFAAAAYALMGKAPRLRRAAVSALGVAAVLLVVYGVTAGTGALSRVGSSNLMLSRVANVSTEQTSVRGRLASISAGLQGFVDRPIFGWGPENYEIAWARHFDAESGVTERFDQAHNKLAEELVTKGIVGLLAYLAVWVVMLGVILRRFREQDSGHQVFTLFIGAALVGYFVQNLFLFDTPATGLQFYVLMGYAVYLELGSRESEVKQPDRAEKKGLWERTLPSYGLAALAVLAVAGMCFGLLTNYRIYEAAAATARAHHSGIAWDERYAYFRDSIDGFQPLANYSRRLLFNHLGADWNNLTEEQAASALDAVDAEARSLIGSEPQGWRGPLQLTSMYLTVSLSRPEYLPVAGRYLDQSRLVAPRMSEVALLSDEFAKVQSLLESGGQDERDEGPGGQ